MEITRCFLLPLPWDAPQLEGGGLGGRDSGKILGLALNSETHLLTLQEKVCWKNTHKTFMLGLGR